MCGITGYWDWSRTLAEAELNRIGTGMLKCIEHRGPDDEGVWADERTGIVLGSRRLAIIDLSPTGHQPMTSADGRYVIVFNGETYNYQDIRRDLPDYPYRGTSDTEVMLAAIYQYGVCDAIKRFNGMFALAVWDRQERTLTIARDHLGIKPLYYGWQGDVFLFGSELKALRAHPKFQSDIDRSVIPLYLRHNAIPDPYSIYQGIHKLPPGHVLTLHEGEREPHIEPYWSVRKAAEIGTAYPFAGSDAYAIRELDTLLRDAVKINMLADVPLGAFLSGGVDSSTVVALMQAQSNIPVKTFTIGFAEQDFNEAEYARAVAQHLGTDHTEMILTEKEAQAVIPNLPVIYDEPFADSSQIPTYLVSKLARQHVTVTLSGDGGDELFAGYNRHVWAQKLWDRVGWMPRPVRQGLAAGINVLSPSAWENLLRQSAIRQIGDKVQKVANLMQASRPHDVYMGLASHWQNPADIMPGISEPPTQITDRRQWAALHDLTRWMMYLDTVTYLPDDILVKVDRASMAVSLESRVPLLDYRVVEFAWTLPLSMKIREGQGKWILRQVLYQYVPQALIERPKSGFAIPLARWLRTDLRDWAAALLDPARLKREGYFRPEPIQRKWAEHLSGKRNWQYELWDILMFQAWLEANG